MKELFIVYIIVISILVVVGFKSYETIKEKIVEPISNVTLLIQK